MQSPGRLRDSTASTPSRHHPKARPPIPPLTPHTPKATLQKGWAPRKTRSLDATPAVSATSPAAAAQSQEPALEQRAHRREAGLGRPAAVRGGGDGRGPEGGGRAGRPRSAPRPAGSHVTQPRAAPGPPTAGAEDGDDDDVQNPGPRRPRAHHLPRRGTGPGGGARGASRQSLPRCPPPTPSPLSSSPPP